MSEYDVIGWRVTAALLTIVSGLLLDATQPWFFTALACCVVAGFLVLWTTEEPRP